MTKFQSCIPLPLPEKELLDVVEKAKDWALMHGAAMRPKANYSPDSLQVNRIHSFHYHTRSPAPIYFLFQFAPFILTPSPFPRQEFERSTRLQPILNELMHWVAYDYAFLEETLEGTIQVDEFTRNLFNIHKQVLEDKDAAQVNVDPIHVHTSLILLRTIYAQYHELHVLLCNNSHLIYLYT